jgi:hypothetical protein
MFDVGRSMFNVHFFSAHFPLYRRKNKLALMLHTPPADIMPSQGLYLSGARASLKQPFGNEKTERCND